jgi:hypothetical protein
MNWIYNYKFSLILLLVFIYGNQNAFGWNARGHMVKAAIAYDLMKSKQQKKVEDILRHHPEFETSWKNDYQSFANDIPLAKYLMMRASVWPDEIRNRNNPYNNFSVSKWHYITYKIDFLNGHDTSEKDGNIEPNIVSGLWTSHQILRDSVQNKMLQAVYLSWLIHLFGDIHQPLHNGSIFSDVYPKGDKGGNLFYVKPKNKGVNIHKIWDGALGRGNKKNVISINNQSQKLRKSKKFKFKKHDIREFNPRKWSLESFNLAVYVAHLNGELKGATSAKDAPPLPEGYTIKLKETSEMRILLAAKRMGWYMNSLL